MQQERWKRVHKQTMDPSPFDVRAFYRAPPGERNMRRHIARERRITSRSLLGYGRLLRRGPPLPDHTTHHWASGATRCPERRVAFPAKGSDRVARSRRGRQTRRDALQPHAPGPGGVPAPSAGRRPQATEPTSQALWHPPSVVAARRVTARTATATTPLG